MLTSGDWVTPTLNGLKYFEKPPLQYWATAAIYAAFGVHEWTARLWAAALAFLCIPLVYFFARGIGYPQSTAAVAAALLALNPYYLLIGQLNLLDQGFTFFLTAAVFSFVIALRELPSSWRSRSWMLVTWAALALAILSKGIVALLLAGATLVAYLALTRDLAILKRLQLAVVIPLFLLIVTPWFYLVQSRNPGFLQFFFVREHFERFFTNVHQRVGPLWYFVPLLAIALLPVIGNWRDWRLSRIEGKMTPGQFRPEIFLLLWCAVVFAFFSLSHSKLPSYLMPVMPALAIVLARVTAAKASAYFRAKWVSIGSIVVLAVALLVAGSKLLGNVPLQGIATTIAIAMTCVAYLAIDRVFNHRSPDHRWLGLAATSIACYQLLALSFVASFPARSTQVLASQVKPELSPDSHVYSVGQYRHSLAFYLHRPLEVYDYSGELDFGMREAGIDPARMNREQFLSHWERDVHAIAFIAPNLFRDLIAAGMPGRVLARDSESVVVAR
jgi:4-amino-4-deoxy-L-arabinose transferase-like glycosyltransferase